VWYDSGRSIAATQGVPYLHQEVSPLPRTQQLSREIHYLFDEPTYHFATHFTRELRRGHCKCHSFYLIWQQMHGRFPNSDMVYQDYTLRNMALHSHSV
jgi:hypothetical protein